MEVEDVFHSWTNSAASSTATFSYLVPFYSPVEEFCANANISCFKKWLVDTRKAGNISQKKNNEEKSK